MTVKIKIKRKPNYISEAGNLRIHIKKQTSQPAKSFQKFGVTPQALWVKGKYGIGKDPSPT